MAFNNTQLSGVWARSKLLTGGGRERGGCCAGKAEKTGKPGLFPGIGAVCKVLFYISGFKCSFSHVLAVEGVGVCMCVVHEHRPCVYLF